MLGKWERKRVGEEIERQQRDDINNDPPKERMIEGGTLVMEEGMLEVWYSRCEFRVWIASQCPTFHQYLLQTNNYFLSHADSRGYRSAFAVLSLSFSHSLSLSFPFFLSFLCLSSLSYPLSSPAQQKERKKEWKSEWLNDWVNDGRAGRRRKGAQGLTV